MGEQPPLIDAPEALESLIDADQAQRLEQYIYELPSGDAARAVALLDEPKRVKLMKMLSPEAAAFLVDELSHPQAAELLEDLPPQQAAAIVDELPSDEQADLLGQLDEEDAQAIIAQMAPQEAQDARLLTRYEPDTAGGIMITEYLAFTQDMTTDDVLRQLRAKAEADPDAYANYDIQYAYVTGPGGELRGVVRFRDLILARPRTRLVDIMIREPRLIRADADLDELEEFFDANSFNAAPVVDEDGRLVGVVRRSAVEEALGDRSEMELLRFGGIITGQELRTMPTGVRAVRRLAFLFPNILLSFISVTIIAFYEPLIESLAALAIFLPLVANLSGAAGNQAVAVSIRELALGLIKPCDWFRVCLKEMGVGLFNGLIVGLILSLIALTMRPDLVGLALVVGGAYACNSVLAVALGGTIPLMLKSLRVDPAIASSPILNTFTDMGSFFITLSLAALTYRSLLA